MRHLLLLLAVFLAPFSVHGEQSRVVPRDSAEISLSFAPVVESSAHAVVNIFATRMVSQRFSPFADDPFFSQFLDQLGVPMTREENSLGSGVIVSADGIVVSNHHVVAGATEIQAVLSDGREFAGDILMSDAEADIAIIQLFDAERLPALDYADSDLVAVGDLVLAIGNPFGVGQTVSSGIISGLARSGANLGNGQGYYLQTDAPINPGNSGGALVDMQGRLVGINTAILTRSGGSNGIGFAIPANLVRRYVEQAVAGNTEFSEPWAGVRVQPVTWDLAMALGQTQPRGVLITEAHPDGPFVLAGLAPGDVVVKLDQKRTDSPAEFDYRMQTAGVGGTVAVTVQRRGTEETVSADLMALPGISGSVPLRIAGRVPLDGLVVSDLAPAILERLDLPYDSTGVVVLDVNGVSRRSGLRPGDLITVVNETDVTGTDALRAVVTTSGSAWRLEGFRQGRRFRLEIRG